MFNENLELKTNEKNPVRQSIDSNDDNQSFEEIEKLKHFSIEELVTYSKNLFKNYLPQQIKQSAQAIHKIIDEKKEIDFAKKKELFVFSGGNPLDFYYKNPIFDSFYTHYFEYKKKLADYYNLIKKQEKENYEKKIVLVQKLKELYQSNTINKDLFINYKNIRNEWSSLGKVPSEHYTTLNENYHHHLKNFFSFLDLNKELQSRLFEENLAERIKLITRAKLLLDEPSIPKALHEINLISKLWKMTQPLREKDNRTTTEEFRMLFNKINERKKEFIFTQEAEQQKNVILKKECLEQLNELIGAESHYPKQWKEKILLFEELKSKFLAIGSTPKSETNGLWEQFRATTKRFNELKINYYKKQRTQSKENTNRKQELISLAKETIENTNHPNEVINRLKKLQTEWKQIGFTDRGISNKLWDEFKGICDGYFQKIKNENQEKSKWQNEVISEKKIALDKYKQELKKIKKESIDSTLHQMVEKWYAKEINSNTQEMDYQFDDFILHNALIANKEAEMMGFINQQKLHLIDENTEEAILYDLIFENNKKRQKFLDEIIHLENNLGFFVHSKPNAITENFEKEVKNKKELVAELNRFNQKITILIKRKKQALEDKE